ncbi:hypothetical protein ACOI1H_18290 [Loktanella sp. DJP18]|uniref:hypothetical protein n=1 Tax=Loktanella sp. DJP18 TaxID=3409788 RepID=UPI003BB4CE22
MKHLIALIFVITTVVGAVVAPGASYAATSDMASFESVSSVDVIDACDQATALKRGDSAPCQEACTVPCPANAIGFSLTQSDLLTFIKPAENRVESTAADALSSFISAINPSPPRRIF